MRPKSIKELRNNYIKSDIGERVGIVVNNDRENPPLSTSSRDKDFSSLFENSNTQWLTTKEAAKHLRISERHLFNLTSNGQIPFYKLGRSNRFLLRDLTELLLAHPRGRSNGN